MFLSELYAIKLAVATALKFKKPCFSCTDSTNSLRCLTKYRDQVQHLIATDAISLRSNISYSFTLVWVPSHKRIVPNKLVNRAAKQGSTCFPFQTYVTIELKLYLDEEFTRNWQNTPTTNKLKSN